MTTRILINRAGPMRAHMIDMLRNNPDGEDVVIHASRRPGSHSYALKVADVATHEPDDDASDEEYGEWAVQYCRDNGIDVLFPTSRMTILADRADEFAAVGTELMCAADAKTSIITDSKCDTYEMMQNLGINVPPFYRVRSFDEFRDAVWSLERNGYVPTVKTDTGWSADSFRIIRMMRSNGFDSSLLFDLLGPVTNHVHVDDYISAMAQASEIPELIVMPYLDDPEISVDVLSDRDGNPISAVSRRKEGNLRIFSGNETEVEMACHIADKVGLRYISNIQFRQFEGKPVLLEINTRAAAGIFHSAVTGANLPWEAVRIASGMAPREVKMDTSVAARIYQNVRVVGE